MLTLCNVHQSCIGKDSRGKKKYGCISSVITFNYEKKYGCIYSVMCVIGKTILIRPVSFQQQTLFKVFKQRKCTCKFYGKKNLSVLY